MKSREAFEYEEHRLFKIFMPDPHKRYEIGLEPEPSFSPEDEEEILAAMKGEGSEGFTRTSTPEETRAFLDSLK